VTAAGARVLNLFSYTCGFSVAAAVGGARETVSVDASISALERGRENFVRAGCTDTVHHKLVGEDAFAYLDRAAKKGETFDVVVLDPPSYSTSKKRRFVAEQHYGELAAKALSILGPGGRLFASTNHRGISRAKLRRVLFAAAESVGRGVAQIKDLAPGSDFPPEPFADPNMKAMLVTLARAGEAVKTAPLPRKLPEQQQKKTSSGARRTTARPWPRKKS
jgi:23S rRNA (cytosine1962-C5)-methyltransferase